MTPRHGRLGVLVGIALLFPLLTAPATFADPLADKRAEATRLREQLERQGEKVSILAEQSNRALLKVSQVEGSLAKTQAEVARSDERLQAVRARLATAAVVAYVHGGNNALIGKLVRGGQDDMIVRTQYLRVTAADQRRIIGEVRTAKQDFELQKSRLEAER
jgi:peptidoglycan hydrolase CwlO-like protein